MKEYFLIKAFCFLMFSAAFTASGQNLTYRGFPSDIWPKLYKVQYSSEIDAQERKPLFTEAIKSLQGKKIVLPGYLVPPENGIKSTEFMLSSLPLNACFFCGVGGPETVIQVFAIDPVKYTGGLVEIQGIFKLNISDPNKMMYILEQAEFLGEVEF